MDLTKTDFVTCRGLSYDCEIGFHDCEKAVKQKVFVDFDAYFAFQANQCDDNPQAVSLDYFMANQQIENYFNKKSPKLIETIASDLANILLREFNILAVRIKVIKHPLDMPNVQDVSFTCFRENTL